MDIRNKRKLILEAAENSINELIKVMNKKIDIDDVDPEKVKISASAYRLAMEDAITLLQKVEEMTNALNKQPTSPKESFYGVENRIQ